MAKTKKAKQGAKRNTGTAQRTRAKAKPKPKRKAKPWPSVFLELFAECGNVSEACRGAGIGRTTAYRHRQADEAFALAWHDVEEEATDKMEAEAYRRGVKGVLKPVFQKGEEVGQIREFSDQLLIVLLKAHKPEKYRERIDHRHSGDAPAAPPLDVSKLSLAEAKSLRALLRKATPEKAVPDRG